MGWTTEAWWVDPWEGQIFWHALQNISFGCGAHKVPYAVGTGCKMADRWRWPLTSMSYWDSEWVEFDIHSAIRLHDVRSWPLTSMCYTERWMEFVIHSAIRLHDVRSWPLTSMCYTERMSGIWHPLPRTPSWREKLTTHLHVLYWKMSGVCHPLRHMPSWREKLTTHLHAFYWKMSGIFHLLRHTPRREKLTTYPHVLYWKNEWSLTSTSPYTFTAWDADHLPPCIVLRFRKSGVWHPLRHTPSRYAQEKRLLPSPVTERSMLAGILVGGRC